MRIKGLIRAFNQARARLQAGLRPEEFEPFKLWAHRLVEDVERICARNGMTPHQLPSPSLRAYLFLKGLDMDNLPERRADQPAQTVSGLRLKNVLSLADHLADRLWDRLPVFSGSAAARELLRQFIEERVAAIEQVCARNNATPAALEKPSREVYCWFKFLLSEENLPCHLAALDRGRRAADPHRSSSLRPLRLHLMRIGPLWRKRVYANETLVKVNEGFLNAGDDVWSAILRSALAGPDPASRECVRAFAASEEFSEVVFDLESLAVPPSSSTQGYAHNLEESFQRVNAAYFDGAMPRPRLVWNRILTGRTFGHYRAGSDTVMISLTLDSPAVPDWVVDFVMYHELLHKKLGTTSVNGRRVAHTAQFRAEERRFARYEAAESELKRLADDHVPERAAGA